MSAELITRPVSELAPLVAAGEVSPVELTRQALARIEALEPKLNAYITVTGEQALADATVAEREIRAGSYRGPFHGIPVGLKDLLLTEGVRTTGGSAVLAEHVPDIDATTVTKLRQAGAIFTGKLSLHEFAYGVTNTNVAFGAVHNPWKLGYIPGGSSGGSGAAVAASECSIALGSDTGGSIRQPASFCGVVGIKPTYGRVSRWGLVAFASSLDQIGVFARSAGDAASLLELICGHDPYDSTSIPEPAPALRAALDGDVSGLVVGLPKECFVAAGVDPEVLAAVNAAVAELERAGAKLREISLPHTQYAIATYYLIATAEASSNLARFDGVRYGRRARGARSLGEMYERTRSEGFGAEVQRRILLGTYVLSAGYYDAYYRKAQQVRTLLRGDFERAFGACDVIVTPTSPEVAFELGAKTSDPLSMYLSDIYTVSANLAGIPGISIPCGQARGLPVGLQLLGPALGEAALLRVADAFERRTLHHRRRPEAIP
jgi:aspartyl-tRNA(Asn)/glutamyl-tRNA(Gln) amidotransferase subunit A